MTYEEIRRLRPSDGGIFRAGRIPELRAVPARETAQPLCPCCGAETDTLYLDWSGEPVGCDACLQSVDAWTWTERA